MMAAVFGFSNQIEDLIGTLYQNAICKIDLDNLVKLNEFIQRLSLNVIFEVHHEKKWYKTVFSENIESDVLFLDEEPRYLKKEMIKKIDLFMQNFFQKDLKAHLEKISKKLRFQQFALNANYRYFAELSIKTDAKNVELFFEMPAKE